MKNDDGAATHDIRMFVLVQAVARATQTHGRHLIKLSQLRHWRRRRFNWRLPVSEKASEVCAVPPPPSSPSVSTTSTFTSVRPFITAPPPFPYIYCPPYRNVYLSVAISRPFLAPSARPRSCTPSPADTSPGGPIGCRDGVPVATTNR